LVRVCVFIEEEALQVSANGRVRRNATEWRAILVRFASSGLSRRAFCQQEKISLASLDRWEGRVSNAAPADFVELKTAQSVTYPWAVEIEFASGCTLRLRG